MEGIINFMLPLVVIFGVFYFVLILPQKKQQKKLSEYVSGLKKGDKVILFAGIICTIESLNLEAGTVIVKSEGTLLKIKKEAISGAYE